MVSEAADQGTMTPDESLHFSVIERPYRDGEDTLDATAADQINYSLSAVASYDQACMQLTTFGAVK